MENQQGLHSKRTTVNNLLWIYLQQVQVSLCLHCWIHVSCLEMEEV